MIALLALIVTVAHAQDGGWVVVVASSGDEAEAAARAGSRAVEHLDTRGQRVLAGPALQQRVATTISRPFVGLTAAEQAQLTTVTDATAQQVMYGDDEGTVRSVAAAIAALDERLAAVGRDDASARRLGDLCLYAVRAHLHARAVDAARRQVFECLRVSPDLDPSPAAHPADVRRLLDEQRSSLPQNGVRLQLAVEHSESCRVRAQGRPIQLGAALPPGRYQIQIECSDDPGRVHDITLTPDATFEVDASLDQALGNRDGLVLRYASEDALRNRLPRHVQALGTGLRVASVLVVSNGPGDALTLERFQVDSAGVRRLASARVALSANERLPPALDALVAGRSVELSDDSGRDPPPRPAPTSDRGPSPLGPALLGAAGLGLVGVAAYGLFAGEECIAMDPGPPAQCARYERPSWLGIGVWGGLGLAALTSAVVWIAVGGSGEDDGTTSVGLGAGYLTVRGTL